MSVISIASGKVRHQADTEHLVNWLYEKAIPWIATALVVSAAIPYMKQVITYFLWQLYALIIERNVFRL